MILVRLTFFSRNRIARTDAQAAGIAAIAATSAANNRRDGLTGALVHDAHWFAQELEGAEAPLSTTFERILRDRRHSDVTLVTMRPVSERRYPGLAMTALARRADNDDLFLHYCDGDGFDPRSMKSDRISDLIAAVVDADPRAGRSWSTKSTAPA